MSDSELGEYAYLWDPANGWTLSAHYNDLSRLRVLFIGKPTLEELKAARALLPLTPQPDLQQFFHRYSKVPEIDAGVMPTRQAMRVAEECKAAGLTVALLDESYTSYLPVHPSGRALVIEHAALAQRVCNHMLKQGVQVTQHVEG